MSEINLTYAPDPEKLVKFIKLQVTDAMLNEEIFGEEPSDEYASVLFALAILAAIPPVPSNRALLDSTFEYIQSDNAYLGVGHLSYAEIARNYNRYLSVFQKAAKLPKRTPMSNPYEEVSRAAAHDLGIAGDGVKLFNLTLWMTHYCKDAVAMFYTEDLSANNPSPENAPRSMPEPAVAYEFISMHVNAAVNDPSFFIDLPPQNATEVITALFFFFGLFLPTRNTAFLQDVLVYTNQLLEANNFTPMFFDRIVSSLESISVAFDDTLQGKTGAPSYYTIDKVVVATLRLMSLPVDSILKVNIISYLPALINDSLSQLFTEH